VVYRQFRLDGVRLGYRFARTSHSSENAHA